MTLDHVNPNKRLQSSSLRAAPGLCGQVAWAAVHVHAGTGLPRQVRALLWFGSQSPTAQIKSRLCCSRPARTTVSQACNHLCTASSISPTYLCTSKYTPPPRVLLKHLATSTACTPLPNPHPHPQNSVPPLYTLC